MIYDIYHKNTFTYQSIVTFSHNLARLKPRNTSFQRLVDFSMEVEPLEHEKNFFVDIFGNTNNHLLIRKGHQSLSVIGRSRVELFPKAIEEHLVRMRKNAMTYAQALALLASVEKEELLAKFFLCDSALIPKASLAIEAYARLSFEPHRNIFDALIEFMGRMYDDFEFIVGVSDVNTSVDEVFESKKGVCQDFAHFAIAALRSIGLPARYMSGYIETLPPEGEEKLFGVDASHAWVSLFIPSVGWIDFDPTNNVIPHSQHILLGYGRDYSDVAPLKGVVMSSGTSQLSISVDVRRVSV